MHAKTKPAELAVGLVKGPAHQNCLTLTLCHIYTSISNQLNPEGSFSKNSLSGSETAAASSLSVNLYFDLNLDKQVSSLSFSRSKSFYLHRLDSSIDLR